MGLLRLAENNTNVNFYEYRDTLYYDTYRYRFKISITGIRIFYFIKQTSDLDSFNVSDFFNSYTKRFSKEIKVNLNLLKSVYVLREQKNKTIKTRIEGNSISIFSNDIQDLIDFKDVGCQGSITEAKVSEFVGVKYFKKKPKHNYRVYLKSKRVEFDQLRKFNQTITSNPSFYPSKRMICNFNYLFDRKTHIAKNVWLSSSYYIDYNDETMLTYLALVTNVDFLGKRYKLEQHPNL